MWIVVLCKLKHDWPDQKAVSVSQEAYLVSKKLSLLRETFIFTERKFGLPNMT